MAKILEQLCCIYILLITFSSSAVLRNKKSISSESVSSIDSKVLSDWIGSSVSFLTNYNSCVESHLGNELQCFELNLISKSSIRVYFGWDHGESNMKTTIVTQANNNNQEDSIVPYEMEKVPTAKLSPSSNHLKTTRTRGINPNLNQQRIRKSSSSNIRTNKIVTILPDNYEEIHDGVIVLDPKPNHNFGHLVGLFYIDLSSDEGKCRRKNQIFIFGESGTSACLTVGTKSQCQTQIENSGGGRINNPEIDCFVDFLPTVKKLESNDNVHRDLLECINYPGFIKCPEKMEIRNAYDSKLGTKDYEPHCKLFQSCDRAVLLSGGWNENHSSKVSMNNLLKVQTMLGNNGFLREDIKSFQSRNASFGFKYNLRRHIKTICTRKHCGDTLFIYLNSPTTSDGNMLLWDFNGNGIVDPAESYHYDEFLNDISNCEAKRVIILADQSNTNLLISKIKQNEPSHENTLVFSPGENPSNGELTNIWANQLHGSVCLRYIQQTQSIWMKSSSPLVLDSSRDGTLLHVTLSGAPCGDNYLKEVSRSHLHQGCQNLPSSVWFSLASSIGDNYELDGTEEQSDSIIETNKSISSNSNGGSSFSLAIEQGISNPESSSSVSD